MDNELFSTLEEQWGRMAQAIEQLRRERDDLKKKVAELEEANGGLQGRVSQMEDEHLHVTSRVESLLSRFEGLGL